MVSTCNNIVRILLLYFRTILPVTTRLSVFIASLNTGHYALFNYFKGSFDDIFLWGGRCVVASRPPCVCHPSLPLMLCHCCHIDLNWCHGCGYSYLMLVDCLAYCVVITMWCHDCCTMCCLPVVWCHDCGALCCLPAVWCHDCCTMCGVMTAVPYGVAVYHGHYAPLL